MVIFDLRESRLILSVDNPSKNTVPSVTMALRSASVNEL